MTLEHIFIRFDQALNWNAALYICYKIIFIILSVTLYTVLPTNDYSLWANINSLIFLFLLWVDCGMRKSVPRFCPEFKSTGRFIMGVMAIQIFILLTSSPWVYYTLSYTTQSLQATSPWVHYLGLTVFLTQGTINTIRLLFHSYFLHKQFNLLAIIIMTAEMLFNLSLLFSHITNDALIYALFANKIISDSVLIIMGIVLLIKLLPTIPIARSPKTPDTPDVHKQFITHSLLVWIATVIKSFTERNFLVPFITYAMGPQIGNIFKVSNDIALVLYRFVLKTIGTADTSLLTYSSMLNKKEDLTAAFIKLTTKIMHLSVPLLGIIIIINIGKFNFFEDHYGFQLFTIMSVCYLLETLLLPFERMLEVKRNYLSLFTGYIPYLAGIFLLTNTTIINHTGIIIFITLIHAIRLTSSFAIVALSCRAYSIHLPIIAMARSYTTK